MSRKALEKEFGASFEDEAEFTHFNIAPASAVPVILNEDRRLFQLVKWGILPVWMEKQGRAMGLINVRSETVLEKETWKKSFKERRCIIPATSFFEWEKTEGKKLPYLIKRKNNKPFSFAGVWTPRKDENGNPEPRFAILTTQANSLLRDIHDRMPVILETDDIDIWLDDTANVDDLMRLMRPYDAEKMEMHRVSEAVNNPRNERKEVLNPL